MGQDESNSSITSITSIIHEVDEPNRDRQLLNLFTAVYTLIAIVVVAGNSLVLYAIHYGNMNTGRLRRLVNVIKSLAINDLLVGLVGMPFRIMTYHYHGKVIVGAQCTLMIDYHYF